MVPKRLNRESVEIGAVPATVDADKLWKSTVQMDGKDIAEEDA